MMTNEKGRQDKARSQQAKDGVVGLGEKSVGTGARTLFAKRGSAFDITYHDL